MHPYAKKGRSSLPADVREKAVGASLSDAGGEGRPGAACLNGVGRPGSPVTETRVSRICVEFRWYRGFDRPETVRFGAIFCAPAILKEENHERASEGLRPQTGREEDL